MEGRGAAGRDGLGEAIGLVYDEVGADLVRAHLEIGDVVRQPGGIVHGGAYAVIAESMCSYATWEAVRERGLVAVGQSNSASFLRPVSSGTIHAVGRRRHGGRTTWIWDVEMSDDEGRMCALVRMTLALRPPPGDPGDPGEG